MDKSVAAREPILSAIEEVDEYDLLVVGGGITGAGIALDASTRGLKVALVEKQDFAQGTSSRSTKLIHGGLRYLKNLEFGLVREVGREREIVYQNAPHLVVPEKMLLPFVEGGTYGKFMASIGLYMYDKLAGVKKEDRRKMLNKDQLMQIEPLLKPKSLKGGGIYAEYRTDDARLTIEVIKTAVENGAHCVNYCSAESLVYDEQKKAVGAVCRDLKMEREYRIEAKQIVNATGPWVDDVRKHDNGSNEKKLHLTKGVHIVVPHSRLAIQHSVYFDAPDGRMLFTIPRGKVTYIGTTDTNYNGDLQHPPVTNEDVEYLLNAVNAVFKVDPVRKEEVISSWAGLRPLIHEEGKDPSELSRKDEIFVSDSGMLSIAGGKLTGYRMMAKRVVDRVFNNLHQQYGLSKVKCKTKEVTIAGGEFERPEEVINYIETVYEQLKYNDLDRYEAEYLVRVYGRQTELILRKAHKFDEENFKIALARAELWYGVHEEQVQNLHDFFIRRTGRMYFNIKSIPPLLNPLLHDMQHYMNWTEEQAENEKKALIHKMEEVSFKPNGM